MRFVIVGGIKTSNLNRAEISELMLRDCIASKEGSLVRPKVLFASNGSVIARYHSDSRFRANIDQADIIDPDGMPLVLVSRVLCRRMPLIERVATTDLIYDAAAAAAASGIRFYFLGGKASVAEKAARVLLENYPDLQVVGTRHGYFTAAEEDEVCADILARKTDVLWVGMGSPHQEEFAIRVRERLHGVAWIRTCGGLFDHVSGTVPRARKWMQSAGLEWLHRMMIEPRRLSWRYLTTNPVACFHLLTKTTDRINTVTDSSRMLDI